MKFRPCIDIHNGKVKQIVGGSLTDEKSEAKENFVSEKDGEYYAALYKMDNLKGGHIIMLNPPGTKEYELDRQQALKALGAYPGGLQIGGGITDKNASLFLDAGASHVIVTSYVFQNGFIQYDNLSRISSEAGKERLVLDVSCRKKGEDYFIVTDRWQKFTNEKLSLTLLKDLAEYCDEFLIHGVDVEGKSAGIDKELIYLLSKWQESSVTYAGGVNSFEDLLAIRESGKGNINVTIGSSLSLFGGPLNYKEVVEWFRKYA
ncbi:phosphoribosylformimino-5-aminoimidazole carboxamide ribotide isomerase [Anaerocolumna xylanovorans]|uniref:1-(5-phosphoribosyl)-5-[(5-phosphoribosylamino)methylideneamino] imidazole-4-carboxamide isomerase n=1 Tax=Anaerocolumna xylanovorans DSM 12503 TaxID=1121345 RepID=A0A1M7YHD3_9FIRM|nr:phosphoribosylformimino-5-aminoimidazole carboxamide ribotide isomerase [Anaerocolumna xylanovorans]SHO51989.1 1-(5-phosphoribosyl)-5-[(5-phosphoribosylamino)methylideneamino] imidazole-4-carboxamide isomerase [Anaerocolumna xylanovorans DSM 12503]